MANYQALKTAIQQVVKTNGNNEITGALLQQSMLSMINSLGTGYQFIGVATPSTNPGTPDQNVFYLASTAGTYSNFNSLSLSENEVAILKYNGQWTKEITGANAAVVNMYTAFGVLAHADATIEKKLDTLAKLVIGIISGTVLVEKLNVRKLGVWGENNLVIVSNHAPDRKPDRAGQFWIDEVNGAVYKSTGNTAVSDWKTI